MKNKINLNLYKLALKQLIIPAAIAGTICLVISATNMFSSSNSLQYLYRYNWFFNISGSKLYNNQPIAAAIAPALILLMYLGSAVFTFVSFKHLNSRSASDFYDSLACSRISGYISRILAVFTWQYGIIVLTMLVRIITMAANGVSFDWSFIPKLLLSFMAGSALIIGCVSLAMSITGTLLSNVVVSLAILGLPRFLLFVADRFIVGASTKIFVDISKFGIFLNPLYNIPTSIILDVTRKWEFYGVSEILINPGAILYTFILGFIYIGAGLLLMKKRKSELAGKSAPNKAIGHIISAAIALPFLAYGFYSLINYGVVSFTNYADIQKCILFIVIGFLIFITFEFIMLRNIKSLLKSIPIFIITIVFSLGLIYTQNKIGLKINSIVPEADEIEYIKIDENYAVIHKYKPLYTYSNLLTKDIEFTDPELIYLMQDNFNKTIDNNNERRMNGNLPYNRATEIYCEFKLKNGKSIYRNVSMFDENKEAIKDLVTNNSEYLDLSYRMPPLSKVNSIKLFTNAIADENFSTLIYESFITEYQNSDLETKNDILFHRNSNYYFRLISLPDSDVYYQEAQFAHFFVAGKINDYNFGNYYYLNRFVPKTAGMYIDEINRLYSASFFEDIENVKENADDNLRYWLDIESIYSGNPPPNLPHEFYMIYNNNEDNTEGGYMTDEELFIFLGMIGQEDFENISVELPIIKLTINQQGSDYSLYNRYEVYAQLSEAEFQAFYEMFLTKIN